MLNKLIPSLFLISTIGFAQELKTEKFEVLAENIDTKEKLIEARGNVVVFSPSYYLSADKILYSKEKESFELFGNVLILKDNVIQTQSDYAYINMKDDSYNQEPTLLMDKNSNIWVNSKSSKKNDTLINLDSSIISSCDCIDPFWSIRVSSAEFDTEDNWLHTYNPRLYFKNVPVFYSPYFGFPTDKTRRTGLLAPTIGYSSSEGLYYSQPIFFALAKDYDLEVVPQIRFNRGSGLYSYFRYADSAYSTLKLKSGVFVEDKEYQIKEDLDNKKHFGWNVEYERTKLFSNNETQDGLYASINWLNDIEYITLENDNDVSSNKKVESKVNYFYNTPEYYGGIYGRYYIDTDLDSNDTTLQEIPQLQFHSYSKEIFDKLTYSTDSKFINYARKDGINAKVYNLTLPLSYTKHFLDDYLYFNVQNKSTLSQYNYSNTDVKYDDGKLFQNETIATIGSDLIKSYSNYFHTVNLKAQYIYPKEFKEEGDLYKITTVEDSEKEKDLSPFPITTDNKRIELSVNESLYDNESLQQIVNHKLSQSILYNEVDDLELHDLENYVKYNFNGGNISNRTTYNVEDDNFVENSTSFSYKYSDYSLSLSYYKSKESENSNRENLESFNFTTTYQISKDYSLSYYENHNLEDNIRNVQRVSLGVDDICWNLNLKYEEKINASSSDSNVINDKVVYINFILKSLGGIKQKYQLGDN